MTYWTDYTQFDKYVELFGSKFAAINYVALLARHRRSKVHNCITESQALAWVVTGVEPEDIQIYYKKQAQYRNRKSLYVQDRLMYIEDEEVREDVRNIISEAIQSHHLIYTYKYVSDECRQARVRILSNMIWDELVQVDIADQI